jgi:hypothetical protein
MIVPGIFFSFAIALVLSLVFAAVIRRRGPRVGFFWFFLLIFLATWAIGVWVQPFGPSLWGGYWLPFLIAGFIVALLATLNALRQAPDEPFLHLGREEQLSRNETVALLEELRRKREARQLTYITVSVFFWLLLG